MERTAHESAAAATPAAFHAPRLGASPVAWHAGLAPLTAPLPHFRRPIARRLCRVLMLTMGQLVAVEHRERLAAVPEPAIFALNHSNALEALLAPTVLLYLRRGAPLHFLADWMFVEAPGLGWLLRLSEPIPVYRKPARCRWREAHRRERARRPVLDACLEHVRRGESVGIFPEGSRNRDAGRLLRGRLGLGELALRAGVPVVPVAIRYPSRPPHGRCRMVLSIGEPLDCAAERRLAAAAGPRRELARRVVDRVMSALAVQLGREYRAGRRGGRGAEET
ncbi:MAG TPA: lysophospholipid acyltransferase family protein [Thermoanaerobaculia bacterium]